MSTSTKKNIKIIIPSPNSDDDTHILVIQCHESNKQTMLKPKKQRHSLEIEIKPSQYIKTCKFLCTFKIKDNTNQILRIMIQEKNRTKDYERINRIEVKLEHSKAQHIHKRNTIAKHCISIALKLIKWIARTVWFSL